MNITERVYQALMDSKKLTAQLVKDRKGRCIYHGISPDAGSYPILVYSMISDVPALAADGQEQEHRITVIPEPLHMPAPCHARRQTHQALGAGSREVWLPVVITNRCTVIDIDKKDGVLFHA